MTITLSSVQFRPPEMVLSVNYTLGPYSYDKVFRFDLREEGLDLDFILSKIKRLAIVLQEKQGLFSSLKSMEGQVIP